MDIKEFVDFQRDFDREHGWDWHAIQDHDELLKVLQYEVIALCGEVGEISNDLKKYLRDDSANMEHRQAIGEALTPEIVDVFVYLLKIASTLNIDIEQAYLAKMAKNRVRFTKYENGMSRCNNRP